MMHIGMRIREVLYAQGLTASWLAEQLPCERSNAYNIFRRPTINVSQLFTISKILNHDFFKELSAELELDEDTNDFIEVGV